MLLYNKKKKQQKKKKKKKIKKMRFSLSIKDRAIVSEVDFVMFIIHKSILKHVQLHITNHVCSNDAIMDYREAIFSCIKKNKHQHETTF